MPPRGYVYSPNSPTPDGRALLERLEDVPDFHLGLRIFAKRLTGTEQIRTNPDKLRQSYGYKNSHYDENTVATSATYSKYGDMPALAAREASRMLIKGENYLDKKPTL